MARFSGIIGYVAFVEENPGDFKKVVTEKNYRGDITSNRRRLENGDYLVDDLTLNNIVSVVADAYAKNNFHHIRYVIYMGVKWKVKTAEVLYPRIKLVLGDVYNE